MNHLKELLGSLWVRPSKKGEPYFSNKMVPFKGLYGLHQGFLGAQGL